MKPYSALCAGLLLLASAVAAKKAPEPVAPKAPVLTQDQVARRAITGILRDMPVDSIALFFDDSVKQSMTPENMKGFKSQIGWLSQFIGDSLDQFMTGNQVMDSLGRTAFFREYRFAAESNKRAPLVIIHLFFDDSTKPLIAGAYNKSFDDDTRNRIADAQVWSTPSGDIDVHSVSYVELEKGILPVIRIYDEDTAHLDSAALAAKAGPAAREAIARGYLAQIKTAKPNATHMDRFGIAYLRKHPREGYGQYTFVVNPEAYRDSSELAKPKATVKKKSGATGAKKTTPKK